MTICITKAISLENPGKILSTLLKKNCTAAMWKSQWYKVTVQKQPSKLEKHRKGKTEKLQRKMPSELLTTTHATTTHPPQPQPQAPPIPLKRLTISGIAVILTRFAASVPTTAPIKIPPKIHG